MFQNGVSSLMNGTVTGIDSYTQSAGELRGSATTGSYALSNGLLTGTVNFLTTATLSGGKVKATGRLQGTAGSSVIHTAGDMMGTVTGVDAYTQSGGTVSGSVTTGSYSMSDGSLAGSADFATLFDLSGAGTVEAAALLNGGAGSIMTQSGGAMNGSVSGVDSYTQSGGTVSGSVTTGSYSMSDGSLAGSADFATLFDLSGAGTVEATALLNGGAGSIMTQSGGAMNGTVTGIDSYTHSGGGIAGSVTTGTYALTDASATSAGGTIDASTLFDLSLGNRRRRGRRKTVGHRQSRQVRRRHRRAHQRRQ